MTLESVVPVSDNLVVELPPWRLELPGSARWLPQRKPSSYTPSRDTRKKGWKRANAIGEVDAND